jgi:hypothetical protein
MRLANVFFVIWLASAAAANAATINAASCSSVAVQAAIAATVAGDTVVIPNGSCTWQTGVIIGGKGIHLKGQSSGGVTITNNVTNGNVITVTEDTTLHTEIFQLTIIGNSSFPAISVQPFNSPNDIGKAVLLHDLTFSDSWAIEMQTNRGVIYNNSFNDHGGVQEMVQCVPTGQSNSWTTPSTMGTNDLTGESNVYVEDNTFTKNRTEALDPDSNCRIVVRHNTFDNSAMASHGADTGPYGMRHIELYNNTFIFTDFHDNPQCNQTMPLDDFFLWRGGTGVITDNTGLVDMNSGCWGLKQAVKLGDWKLQADAGPDPCWGEGTTGGALYPSPRQMGYGYVTGNGRDGLGRSTDTANNPFCPSCYVGDSEPLYIWNQNLTPAYSNGAGSNGVCTVLPLETSQDYIKLNRDYFLGTPKPGYTKYPYPHPLRSATGTRPPTAPTNLRIVQ